MNHKIEKKNFFVFRLLHPQHKLYKQNNFNNNNNRFLTAVGQPEPN